MKPEMKHYKRIASIKSSHDGDILAVLTDDVKNDYHTEILPVVPKGAELLVNFGGDFGVYAVAAFDGQTHKVKIDVHEFHKIEFVEGDTQ